MQVAGTESGPVVDALYRAVGIVSKPRSHRAREVEIAEGQIESAIAIDDVVGDIRDAVGGPLLNAEPATRIGRDRIGGEKGRSVNARVEQFHRCAVGLIGGNQGIADRNDAPIEVDSGANRVVDECAVAHAVDRALVIAGKELDEQRASRIEACEGDAFNQDIRVEGGLQHQTSVCLTCGVDDRIGGIDGSRGAVGGIATQQLESDLFEARIVDGRDQPGANRVGTTHHFDGVCGWPRLVVIVVDGRQQLADRVDTHACSVGRCRSAKQPRAKQQRVNEVAHGDLPDNNGCLTTITKSDRADCHAPECPAFARGFAARSVEAVTSDLQSHHPAAAITSSAAAVISRCMREKRAS
ncbi:MAG: hypothetical protein BWZ07_02408 [Alphaproteobacteria bacterium ADurb.BinA280]|nr:MAG: hypothetical protein BWZ07_02408 [Alphaproteobacteria bacterium ADurb.BinA280]